MDGFIGLSSRRSNIYNRNLGVQKLGIDPGTINTSKIQIVGYYESSTNTSTLLGSGSTSPNMYLKAGDVIYVMGCEGYIGSTTGSTAATTFTNQGRVSTTWQPRINNVRTGEQYLASHTEAAMLNARQNEWSPSNFVSTDWGSVGSGQTSTLNNYKGFLVLKIIKVPTTGVYTLTHGNGPRGTGTESRHVYAIAFRGVDNSRLTTTYYEWADDFVKAPRSRISTGDYAIGINEPFNQSIIAYETVNSTNTPLVGGIVGRNDIVIHIGILPDLDLIGSSARDLKSNKIQNFLSSMWSNQWDGGGGLNTVCTTGNSYTEYSLTYNDSAALLVTPGSVATSCYGIIVPSIG